MMTRNQIDWQNMKIAERRASEEQRHNLAMEQETRRANRASEQIKRDNISIELDKLNEVMRSNDLNYSINYARNSEQARHNSIAEANEFLRDSNNFMTNQERNRISELTARLQDTNADLDREVTALRDSRLDARERASLQAKINNDLRNFQINLSKIANEKQSIENRYIIDRVNATTNVGNMLSNALRSSKELLNGLFR